MTVKASGSSLSFTDIYTEFGLPPGKNLGAYRLNGGITVSGLESLALDNEVNSVGIITPLMPRSGAIKFSDFYGKKLNVVVDYTVATGYATRKDYSTARAKYNDGSNTTILGFALKDEAPDTTKVWIHTNGNVGSDQKASGISTTYCSLLTGTWSATTDLRLDIGTSGAIYGAGGNGGKGGDTSGGSSSGGEVGKTGSSALGIQHTPIIITNRGSIVAGGGGAGGGGAGNGQVHKRGSPYIGDGANKYYFSAAGGGGGGGGRGLPSGNGGGGGSVALPGNRMDGSTLTAGNDGSNGTKSAGGKGGNNSSASNNDSSATGGVGGGGANNGSAGGSEGGTNGTSSQGGSGSSGSDSSGNIGGLSGYSIIFLNNGTGVTINGNVAIGNTITNTIPK
jgi:hypothetical protein